MNRPVFVTLGCMGVTLAACAALWGATGFWWGVLIMAGAGSAFSGLCIIADLDS